MQTIDNDRTEADTSERIGETASFPYDRMTVERFRERFPKARWSDERKVWFVPGKTAGRRIDRWLANEAAQVDTYADLKGRDAFAFDPIESRYLETTETGFRIRTPYSKTVVQELRAIPWAHWDSELRVWQVPYRSYEELRRHWPAIEEAARRNEPDERKKRADERRNTDEGQASARIAAERRRRRYPVPVDDMPPLDQPIETGAWGVVVFTGSTGELVDTDDATAAIYPERTNDRVWATWRTATLEELVKTWPAKQGPSVAESARGWWRPSINVLRNARRYARRQATPG